MEDSKIGSSAMAREHRGEGTAAKTNQGAKQGRPGHASADGSLGLASAGKPAPDKSPASDGLFVPGGSSEGMAAAMNAFQSTFAQTGEGANAGTHLMTLLAGAPSAIGPAAQRELRAAGLSLSREQAACIAESERAALREAGRVCFGARASDGVIEAFASSPYMMQETLGDVLAEAVEAFYELREEFDVNIPDQEIIDELRCAFDSDASGSIARALDIAGDALRAVQAQDALADYELVDDEGRVYRWDPDEWRDDITATGWFGERWEDDYE